MHLRAKANSLSVQTFLANKSLSDSDCKDVQEENYSNVTYLELL